MDANIEHLVVVDLEATTSSDGSLPKEEMETIEIGAVFVSAKDYRVEREFQSFVRPVRHPTLRPFCTELTSITQSDVDAAPSFPVVFRKFCESITTPFDRTLFGSWGRFDKTQFERDCLYHDIPYTLPPHINLKDVFSATQGKRRLYAMSEALHVAGVELVGTHHRGIDDARNIASLLPWILGDRRL